MQSKATSSRGRDNVRVKELGEGTSQRERGYRWVVESRLDGKRSRKFFRHGEIAERNTHVALVLSTIENLAKADRSIITDSALLEEASRASKELQLHGKNISDAASFYLAHLKSEATRDSTPVSDVIKRFMDEKDRLGISVSHRRDLRYRLRRFESDHGASPVSSWNRRAITRWILGLELGPQSQVNYRAVLQAMFEFAVKEEIIPVNPVTHAAKPRVRRKKTRVLKPEKIATLLSHCSDELLPAVVLVVFGGVRNSEVCRLDWRDINLRKSTCEITADKAKCAVHARISDLPENAIAWLRPLAKHRGPIAPFASEDMFNAALKELRKDAGWRAGNWPRNALRATCISAHVASYQNVGATALWAGTSEAVIHQNYREVLAKDDGDAHFDVFPATESEGVKVVGMGSA